MKKTSLLLAVIILSSFNVFSQKIGETVSAFSKMDNGWFDASIKEVKDTSFFIHYVGYDPQYDEWLGKSQIKVKCPKLAYLSNHTKLVPDAFTMVDASKRENEKILKVVVMDNDWTLVKNGFGVITSRTLNGRAIAQNTKTGLCFEVDILFSQQNTSSGGASYGKTQFNRHGIYENAEAKFSIDCLK